MTDTEFTEFNIVGDTKAPLLRCSFYFQAKFWGNYDHRTVQELSDI